MKVFMRQENESFTLGAIVKPAHGVALELGWHTLFVQWCRCGERAREEAQAEKDRYMAARGFVRDEANGVYRPLWDDGGKGEGSTNGTPN